MEPDRHKLWRRVGEAYQALKEHAPRGLRADGRSLVTGRPESLRLAQAETHRDPAFPWVILRAATGDGETIPRDENIVVVPEHYIERIELRFTSAGVRPVGFAHREREDEPSSSA